MLASSLYFTACRLTDLAALDFGSLKSVHGGLRVCNRVVLDETISRLERNLCQPTIPVEQLKHVTLGNSLLGQIAYALISSCFSDGLRRGADQ